MTTYCGSMVALITPFTSTGEIDWDALARLVDMQLDAGTHGLIICGTTGEAATMTEAEQGKVLAFVVKQVKGRTPVIGGTGTYNTKKTIEMSQQAKEVGCDGLLVVTPPYNKPTQRGLVAHFTAVADTIKMPLLLYNSPGRSACDLVPASVEELARNEHIVGIKDATSSMAVGSEIYERCGDSFALLSGDDFTALPLMSIGGQGWISVSANIAPAEMVAMYDAWQAGDVAKARQLHYQLLPLHRAMFWESNPAPCKKALQLMGVCETATVRLPLVEVTEENGQRMAHLLMERGLLP